MRPCRRRRHRLRKDRIIQFMCVTTRTHETRHTVQCCSVLLSPCLSREFTASVRPHFTALRSRLFNSDMDSTADKYFLPVSVFGCVSFPSSFLPCSPNFRLRFWGVSVRPVFPVSVELFSVCLECANVVQRVCHCTESWR